MRARLLPQAGWLPGAWRVALIGLLLIGVINDGLILSQIPALWQQVVKGAILLSAVLYDGCRRHSRDDT